MRRHFGFFRGFRRAALILSATAFINCPGSPLGIAGEVKESYDDGKPKVHYRTDDKDRRIGVYEEFYPTGKPKVRGQYTLGKKSGQWQTLDENGKVLESATYRNDQLDGAYVWDFPSGKPGLKAQYHNGQLNGPLTVMDEKGRTTRHVNYPRSRSDVEKMFLSLYYTEKPETKFSTQAHVGVPYKAGVLSPETLEAAVKVTKLYRYLSGVPWEDLKADPTLCDKSAHGAVILAKLGKLTHTPEQPPDMDKEFYTIASEGCGQANIYVGDGSPVSSVRGFMDDSDESNVDRVGHRQWVLSPGLQHVGFGSADRYVSMHVFDGNRPSKLDYNYIAFPGEGYYPRRLVEAHYAWSLHLNNTKVKIGPASSIKITLQKLDEHYQPDGEPIGAKVVSTPGAMSPYMGWSVIVFKPELSELETAKYWVDVQGVKAASGAEAPFGYIVELIDIVAPEKPAPESDKSK